MDKTEPNVFSQPLAYGCTVHETLKRVYDPSCPTAPSERDIERLAWQAACRQRYPDPEMRCADAARCAATVRAYVDQDPDVDGAAGLLGD